MALSHLDGLILSQIIFSLGYFAVLRHLGSLPRIRYAFPIIMTLQCHVVLAYSTVMGGKAFLLKRVAGIRKTTTVNLVHMLIIDLLLILYWSFIMVDVDLGPVWVIVGGNAAAAVLVLLGSALVVTL